MPQQPSAGAANVDSAIVKTIATLYTSQADKEAEALYQETSTGMSARERLKLSHIIQEEVRRIRKASKASDVARPNVQEAPDTITARNPVKGIPNLFDSCWDYLKGSAAALLELAGTLLESSVYFLYFAFWIALAIVVFHMACKIIGF